MLVLECYKHTRCFIEPIQLLPRPSLDRCRLIHILWNSTYKCQKARSPPGPPGPRLYMYIVVFVYLYTRITAEKEEFENIKSRRTTWAPPPLLFQNILFFIFWTPCRVRKPGSETGWIGEINPIN